LSSSNTKLVYTPTSGSCIDEVKETIPLHGFDLHLEVDHLSTRVSKEVVEQIRELVSIVALMYRNNPFHNFEHACHVTMSVNKLIKRIAATESILNDRDTENESAHGFSRSIYSDPLALLAIVFSALIHGKETSTENIFQSYNCYSSFCFSQFLLGSEQRH
jgi:hypothetical protein